MFKTILGSFCALVSNGLLLVLLTVERNRVKFGTQGVVITCIWGIFDLLVFKVFLGSFGALGTKWPVT